MSNSLFLDVCGRAVTQVETHIREKMELMAESKRGEDHGSNDLQDTSPHPNYGSL